MRQLFKVTMMTALNGRSICLLGVLALLVLVGATENAAASDDLHGPDCHKLRTTLESWVNDAPDVSVDDLNCAAIAGGVVQATGKHPWWAGCVGRGDMVLAAHIARCVAVSQVVKYGQMPVRLQHCASITRIYETGLQAASENGALPADYAAPSCDQIADASLLWQAGRSAWLRCRGYDRKEERAHATACLLYDEELAAIPRHRLCHGVQELYEQRLLDAYGQLPEGYIALKCRNARQLIEAAEREITRLEASRRRARELADKARQAALRSQDAKWQKARLIAKAMMGLAVFGAMNAGSDLPPPMPGLKLQGPGAFGCPMAWNATTAGLLGC